MVESLDDAVGQLLDTLDRLKLTEKTIVVFFSDNGGNRYSRVDDLPPTSNAPLRGGKAMIYEGGVRVPCAVVWPGTIKPGSNSDAMLVSTDWYPTLLEMLDIDKPSGCHLDGVSQMSALLGKVGPRKSFVCFVPNYYPKPGTVPSTSIRRGPWKLIRFYGDGPDRTDRFELYNLDDDIGESKNLASSKPQLAKELNAAITAYLADTKAAVPVANPGYKPGAVLAKASSSPSPKAPRKARDPVTFFKSQDANGDGFVTLEEYIGNPENRNVPALTNQFKQRDHNKDSKLTLEEMKDFERGTTELSNAAH